MLRKLRDEKFPWRNESLRDFSLILTKNIPCQPAPWSMVPALFGWGGETTHCLRLEPSELTLIRGGDTSDGMTYIRIIFT